MRELIKVAQALEACIKEGQQGHQEASKKRDRDDFTSKLLLSKKGMSGMFKKYKKKGMLTVLSYHQPSGKMMNRQTQGQTLQIRLWIGRI